MKIHYVAPCRTRFPSMAASSIHMMKMCEAYSKLGHDVCLIASFSDHSEAEILNAYGIKHKFKIHQVKVSDKKYGNVSYAVKAAHYTNCHKPDIALGRSVTALSIICLMKFKVTIDLHGPVWEFNKVDYLLFRKILKSKYLNKLTVNSQALKEMYVKKGFYNSNNIVVAHNGSDPFLPITDHTDIQDIFSFSNLNVGYFGSLYSGRGVELIVELANNFKDIDFHFFGGSELEVSEWKDKTENNMDNVHFHGHIPHAKVAFYRNKCDILLAPYSSNGVAVAGGKGDSSQYMNPIKIVEYMSSGKAIITSDLSVLKEVLGEDGAIFSDPNKIEQWLVALEVLMDKSTRDKYGEVALSKFKEGLTWEARAMKLL